MFTLSYLVSMLFVITNITLIFIQKNIKYYVLIMLGWMWILYWGSTNNADSENYLLLYETVQTTGSAWATAAPLFVLLMKITIFFNLDYNHFLMFISFLALYLIYKTIHRYTDKLIYVFSLYFIYPFLLDIVQVRHFLAMAIVIYSVQYIEKRQYKRYILGILLAFNIQFSAIMFLPFIFIEKMNVKKIWIITLSVIAIGLIVVKTHYMMNIAGLIVPIEKVRMYFENQAKLGFLLQWVIQILFLLPIYFIYTTLKQKNIHLHIVELIYKLNIYLLMMFPLYIINLNSSRVFRMLIILNYIAYAIGFSRIYDIKRYLLFMYILFLTIGMYVGQLSFVKSVLFPIFNNNLILN